jgi:hypothetical protein
MCIVHVMMLDFYTFIWNSLPFYLLKYTILLEYKSSLKVVFIINKRADLIIFELHPSHTIQLVVCCL